MDSPSPFGTFSAFPVEIRRQVWHELLCEPVTVLTPLWLSRAQHGSLYEIFYKRTPFDVAIFQCSKACGLEAMEVFYSGKHIFSFCALPSRWELEFVYSHNRLRVSQFVKDFKNWTPLYPTPLAASHVKNIWLSISIPNSKNCFGGFHMSDHSLCMELMRKLHSSGGVRKTCFIDLVFFCNDNPTKAVQVLPTSFFRGFKTLTAFEKVHFNISGSPNLAHLALNPTETRPRDLDGYANWDLKCYIMQRIVEQLEPVLGPAAVLDQNYTHVIQFHPRTHLAKYVKAGSISTM